MRYCRSIASWSSQRWTKLAPTGLALLLATGIVAAKDNAAASAASTNAPAPELVIPTSVFNSSPQAGRNPFFPRSAREASKTADAAPTSRFPEDIRLGGFSKSASRQFAIINGVTIALGETGEIKASSRRFNVRVIAVREDSVVISINGVTQEIFSRK